MWTCHFFTCNSKFFQPSRKHQNTTETLSFLLLLLQWMIYCSTRVNSGQLKKKKVGGAGAQTLQRAEWKIFPSYLPFRDLQIQATVDNIILNTWVHIKLPLLFSNGPFKISVLTGQSLQGPAQKAHPSRMLKKIICSQMVIHQMLENTKWVAIWVWI